MDKTEIGIAAVGITDLIERAINGDVDAQADVREHLQEIAELLNIGLRACAENGAQRN